MNTEESVIVKIEQDDFEPSDDPSLPEFSTVNIKEEFEIIEDEDTIIIKIEQCEEETVLSIKQQDDDMDIKPNVDDLQLFQEGSTSNTGMEQYCTGEIQIKDEIKIEVAEVESYSEIETSPSKFLCTVCDFRCDTKSAFDDHLQAIHSKEKRTRCSICFKPFEGTSQLEKHIAHDHNGFGEACKICLEQYKKGQTFEHRRQCQGRQIFYCDKCKTSYVKKKGLLKHLDEHGIAEDHKESVICESRVKEQLLTCVICEDDKAYRNGPLRKHVEEQHDGHYLRCPNCRKTFKDRSNHGNHIKKHCKLDPTREKVSVTEVACPECSRPYKSKAALDNHIANTHRKKPFLCSECGLKFISSSKLRYHKVNYHMNLTFACSYCEKKFYYERTLREHLVLHQNQSSS